MALLSVRRRSYGTENLALRAINTTILTPYDFLAWTIAFTVLIIYATYPDTRATADTGLIIGAVGLLMGFLMSMVAPKWIGDVKFELDPIGLTADTVAKAETYLLVVLVLTGASFGIQRLVFWYAQHGTTAQAALSAPTDYVGLSIFVFCMAIMEECFFRFFLYRLGRALSFGYWIIPTIIISLGFGYGYHQYVYNNDFVLESAAFVGSLLYCAGLQYTRRMLIPTILHIMQNLPRGNAQSLIVYATHYLDLLGKA